MEVSTLLHVYNHSSYHAGWVVHACRDISLFTRLPCYKTHLLNLFMVPKWSLYWVCSTPTSLGIEFTLGRFLDHETSCPDSYHNLQPCGSYVMAEFFLSYFCCRVIFYIVQCNCIHVCARNTKRTQRLHQYYSSQGLWSSTSTDSLKYCLNRNINVSQTV